MRTKIPKYRDTTFQRLLIERMQQLRSDHGYSQEEVIEFTGHAIGGVCPFGIENKGVKIYLDTSLKRFETVYPACGSGNSAIKLTCNELELLSNCSGWVDVCKAE